jgi:hypothetical protein
MNAQDFARWLQGFAELNGDTPPTPEQWKSIREHLQLCFVKVTPPVMIRYPDPFKGDPLPYVIRREDTTAVPSWPGYKAGDIIC